MPLAHSTVKRLSVAVVKLYYSLCCLLVSRHGILQKTVSIHFDFCQITSPLHQYSPSELFKRRQSLGEGGWIYECAPRFVYLCVFQSCDEHTQVSTLREYLWKNDYLGKNRSLMKITPLQFAAHRPAVRVLVYGYYWKSLRLHRELSNRDHSWRCCAIQLLFDFWDFGPILTI